MKTFILHIYKIPIRPGLHAYENSKKVKKKLLEKEKNDTKMKNRNQKAGVDVNDAY